MSSGKVQTFLLRRAKEQVAFYGSTRNYAFQFDDIGFTGLSARLNDLRKAGDLDGMRDAINDGVVEKFAVVGRWDEIPGRPAGPLRGHREPSGDLSGRGDHRRRPGGRRALGRDRGGHPTVAGWP